MAIQILSRTLPKTLTLSSFFSRSLSTASSSSALLSRSPLFFLCRSLRPLAVASTDFRRLLPSPSLRAFSTRAISSSLNDPNPNWSNRPPKETILLDGCDFEHWLVVMEKPEGEPTRDEIIDSYIKTLAKVVGSEEEARMKIYSVSTRHYYAFGALVSEELSYKLKELPGVRWVLPDSYLDVKNKDYGGEPFINGQAAPYDPKYHEEWVRNNARANERNRRNDRPRNADRSRNFDRRRENILNRDMQNRPPMSYETVQNPGANMGGAPPNNMGRAPPSNAPNMQNIVNRDMQNRPPMSYETVQSPGANMGGAPPNMGRAPPSNAPNMQNIVNSDMQNRPPMSYETVQSPGANMGGAPPNMGRAPPSNAPNMGGAFPSNAGGYPPNMGGAFPSNAGGYPPNMGGAPPSNAGSFPPNSAGGLPPNNAGGFPPYNSGGFPPNNAGGFPPNHMGGVAPNSGYSSMLPNSTVGGMTPSNMGGMPPNQNMGGVSPNAGWSSNFPGRDDQPNYTPNRDMGGPTRGNPYSS